MEPAPAVASDADLLRRYAVDRSDEAFAELVRRYVDLVYATSLRRVGDPHLADDVTQAVYLVLARRAADLGPPTVLPGWLYRTARLVSNDAVKMQRRRQRHERAAARPELAPPAPDPGVRPEIEAALDRLSTADRDAVLLRYWQGLSVGEVARSLGVAENTAAKRLGRAVGRLRGQLAGGTAATAVAALGTPSAPAGVAAACRPTAAGGPAAALARHALRSPWRAAVGVSAAAAAAAGLIAAAAACVLWVGPPAPGRPAVAVIALQAPPPAVGPLTAEQDRQVRAAVDRLRHFAPFARMDDWPKAVRTLVEAGRPAVPEIVAELDRTGKDSELRALAFTLRAIGDPRACPALIRALRRTAVLSSDLGLKVSDPGLAGFLRAHQIVPSETESNPGLGQAMREALTALKGITRHSEGEPFRFRNGFAVDDRQRAAARQHLDHLADAWQRWWDEHHGDVVGDAELATLTAGPHGLAAVEAAGEAVNGPLFPTGRPYQFGPVRDLWVDPVGERYDTRSLVSFGRPDAFTLLDALTRLPAGAVAPAGESWWLGPPVSADAVCQQYTFPVGAPPSGPPPKLGMALILHPGETADVYSLYSDDVDVWPVDGRTWDTLPADVAAGRRVALDPAGPESDFRWPPHDDRHAPAFPATYVIRTARGGAGIVQLVESSAARRQLHLRYRMATTAGAAAAAATAPTTDVADAPRFGSPQQATLPGVAAGAACALALGNGQVARAPADLPVVAQPDQWVRDAGADVTTTRLYRQTGVGGVRFVGAVLMPLSDDAFDHAPASLVATAAAHVRGGPDARDAFILSKGAVIDGTRTAVFVTGDGAAGIVQLVGVSQVPPSATLRWKVLDRGADAGP